MQALSLKMTTLVMAFGFLSSLLQAVHLTVEAQTALPSQPDVRLEIVSGSNAEVTKISLSSEKNGQIKITGAVGAVKGEALLVAKNLRTNQEVLIQATSGGSFTVFLGAVTGDQLSLLSVDPLPESYSAAAIEAWVVDEDTGQPLAGVIVTANWELEGPEGYPLRQMMVMEAVTDANGRLYFPPWGPKPRPRLEMPGAATVNPTPTNSLRQEFAARVFEGQLRFDDPRLLLFKSGYTVKGLQNEISVHPNTGSFRRSDWDGKTIKLKKFTGSVKEWAVQVSIADRAIHFAFQYDDCSWKQIPRMLVAIDREVKPLRGGGIFANFHSIEEREDEANPSKCGSTREFLRSYLP